MKVWNWILDQHARNCPWCFLVEFGIFSVVGLVWYRIEGWPHRLDGLVTLVQRAL